MRPGHPEGLPVQEAYRWSATDCVARLRRGEVSPVDLVEAAIARIEAVDPKVNALPVRCFERALEQARAMGPSARALPLAGLPIAVKDYNDVGGVRTTYGSPIFADNVAARSDATVQRLEANGAIPLAKSNVPEWAGGNTVNPVLGATRNPWNTALTVGGSSGGSAAALAAGMVWLATGNDLGGSLRTPAAFNAVVGLRPSPGRVPRGQRLPAFDTLWVEGPMARSVRDVALMLDASQGAHPEDPLAFDGGEGPFVEALERAPLPRRVAFSRDLGVVAVEPAIARICERAAARFAGLGVDVTGDAPDFGGALDAFRTLRAVLMGTLMEPLLAEHRARIAPDIVDNVERGFRVTPPQLFAAERSRWALAGRISRFFEDHDLLICPAVSVPPFPVEQPWVERIDGRLCETYIDWFAITFALTLTACPVLCLPCGFTADGLPVGIQLMGRPRGEAALLAAAAALESTLDTASALPDTTSR